MTSSGLSHTYVADLFRSSWKQEKYNERNKKGTKNLSKDVMMIILQFCDARSVANLSRTSREFYQLCSQPSIWKSLYLKRWKLNHGDIKYLQSSWQHALAKREIMESNWKYGVTTHISKIAPAHTQRISCLSMSQNAVVSGSSDKKVKIWDLASGKMRFQLDGHAFSIRCVQSDNFKVISAGSDRTVRIWSMQTGATLGILNQHNAPVHSMHYKDATLATGGRDANISLWDLNTFQAITHFRMHIGSIRSTKLVGDNYILSGSSDRSVRLWDKRLSNQHANVLTIQAHHHQVDKIMITQNDELDMICTASLLGNKVKMWDFRTGMRVFSINTDRISCVDLSSGNTTSGMFITTGHGHPMPQLDNPVVCVWDGKTGELKHEMHGHQAGITCIQSDREGKIVSGSRDGTVRVWNVESGKETTQYYVERHPVHLVYRNNALAVATSGATLSIFDFEVKKQQPATSFFLRGVCSTSMMYNHH